ncbi:hypothetical protein Tco_0016320 [Tanacetum coccineum]
MKNHESRPTGYAPLSEANVVAHNQNGGRGRGSDRRRGRRHGCGHGRVWIWLRSQKNKGKGVEVNLAYQDEKIDNFDIDSFGIDSLDVDPKDQNDTTHLDVSDFLTNDLSIKQILAMSNLVKLEFLVLDISGQNYLSWVLDAKIYLAANGLGDTIQAGKETTVEQKAKAMIFLCHYLHENLNFEYLTIKGPLESTPTGYCAHISEANVVAHNQNGGRGRGSDRRRGRRHGCGHGRVWIWLSLDVDPKDQNDTTHLDVSDFLTNDLSIKQIVRSHKAKNKRASHGRCSCFIIVSFIFL